MSGNGSPANSLDEKGLGKRVQQARQAAGLTQQVLCHKTGLSYSTLTKIERGAIASPSVFTIQTIAAELGLSLDDLLQSGHKTRAGGKQRSKSGVSFVYFDINGCLVHFFNRAFTHLSAVSGLPADLIETTFWHYNDQVCRGDMSMGEFNRHLAKELQLPEVDWLTYYIKAIEPIPETYELLHWAAKHYRIGLLSNIMPGFIKVMREKGFIPELSYDAIIDSSEVGAIKPEAKIYEIAQAKANCPPSEILLVDDSRTNLMAAEKQGWHVLWFDDYRPAEAVKRLRATLEPTD